MALNHMQEVAVNMYDEWYHHPERRKRPWFEISGPAGSGKTFLVRYIIEHIGLTEQQAAFMAYVGKATLALRLNGLNARTIHNSIYDLGYDYIRDEHGSIVMNKGRPKKKMAFFLKPELPKEWRQIVIDEGGMVGDKIGEDILSFGIPTMVLGDLNQLPPVMAKRMFLEKPDVQLNEVMRQEKDSPIIYLSQLASHGIRIPFGTYGDNECRVIHKDQLRDEDLYDADIVICGTNRMRDTINLYIRENIQGIKEPYLTEGDKLICRQNKWGITLNDDITLVNGLIGYATKIYKETRAKGALMEIDFRPEFYKSERFNRVPIKYDYPFQPYDVRMKTNVARFGGSNVLFEFGNCITCHLAQGSQYDNVVVYVENCSDSLYFRQWLYTAITRAKKKLTLVI